MIYNLPLRRSSFLYFSAAANGDQVIKLMRTGQLYSLQQGLYAALAKPRLACGKYRAGATNGARRGISQSPGRCRAINLACSLSVLKNVRRGEKKINYGL